MNEFKFYRKRPVVIMAKLLTEPEDIPTLENVMHADAGDYLIIGVEGERYPCKPGIFAKTYEEVTKKEETECNTMSATPVHDTSI